jgi:hypothetical protein
LGGVWSLRRWEPPIDCGHLVLAVRDNEILRLAEEVEGLRARAEAAENRWMTPNEHRAKMGLPPLHSPGASVAEFLKRPLAASAEAEAVHLRECYRNACANEEVLDAENKRLREELARARTEIAELWGKYVAVSEQLHRAEPRALADSAEAEARQRALRETIALLADSARKQVALLRDLEASYGA